MCKYQLWRSLVCIDFLVKYPINHHSKRIIFIIITLLFQICICSIQTTTTWMCSPPPCWDVFGNLREHNNWICFHFKLMFQVERKSSASQHNYSRQRGRRRIRNPINNEPRTAEEWHYYNYYHYHYYYEYSSTKNKKRNNNNDDNNTQQIPHNLSMEDKPVGLPTVDVNYDDTAILQQNDLFFPREIFTNIFSFLRYKDIACVLRTCKLWNR